MGGEGVTVADHSLFSVSGGFTQVNLQATWDGSAWTRAFAANQYDFIGNLDIIVLFFFLTTAKKGGKIEYGEMKKNVCMCERFCIFAALNGRERYALSG